MRILELSDDDVIRGQPRRDAACAEAVRLRLAAGQPLTMIKAALMADVTYPATTRSGADGPAAMDVQRDLAAALKSEVTGSAGGTVTLRGRDRSHWVFGAIAPCCRAVHPWGRSGGMRFALAVVLAALLQAGSVGADEARRERATRALQHELGLPETGLMDGATRAALFAPMTEAGTPRPALSAPEASVSLDLGGDAGCGRAGGSAARNRHRPDRRPAHHGARPAAELSDASAIYAQYEMGRLSLRPETWVPFSVIGEDERVAVNDTTSFPERAIVQILFQNAFDGTSLCSGMMVSADTVLTAAHCIHGGTVFGRAYSAYRVLPGRNRAATPFGECGVRRAHVLQDWTAATSAERRAITTSGR
ncbi:trypsin-like serine peptidase [Rhodovulum sp.]|uniref:trypsin-like serine peptidase n=1 Tax=Rhodovulum sp. TaxID=34009 RepID=UPI001803C14A|nr:trypsin-like serine protease [Rhodovulum sp.]HDR28458.1 trypsin-like serine protease [Rhodovulum sp.]